MVGVERQLRGGQLDGWQGGFTLHNGASSSEGVMGCEERLIADGPDGVAVLPLDAEGQHRLE